MVFWYYLWIGMCYIGFEVWGKFLICFIVIVIEGIGWVVVVFVDIVLKDWRFFEFGLVKDC